MVKVALFFLTITVFCTASFAQDRLAGLRLEKGSEYKIQVEFQHTLAQQALEKALDIKTVGTVWHHYSVLDSNDRGYSLSHSLDSIHFNYEGLGSVGSYNSTVASDREKEWADPVNRLLGSNYRLETDRNGKVVAVTDSHTPIAAENSRIAAILTLMTALTGINDAPRAGSNSFFGILPSRVPEIGESWTVDEIRPNIVAKTVYTIRSITDSTLLVDFTSTDSSYIREEKKGTGSVTVMKNLIRGQMVLDLKTGVMLSKFGNIDGHGTTEALGTIVPITARGTISVTVSRKK